MVEQGFAEEIPRNELHPSWRSYYLSTRPVIRKGAATTKCRIVRNASQADQNNKSHTSNKMLMPGPNILPQIMKLIIHFMTFEYLFLIDVQKMFLPIELELKSDREMPRFVWSQPRQEIKHYRMKVVTFGLISSPYQADSCLKDMDKVHALMYPLAAAIVIADSYMMTSPPVPYQYQKGASLSSRS